MRKSDKLKNFKKVNLLVEQRYLESKGIVTESHFADPMSKGTKIKFNGRDAEVIAFEANPRQEVSYTIKYDDNGEEDQIVGGDKRIKLNESDLDEYDYNKFDRTYGTLEKDRKEKILQFGKDRQFRDGIRLKSLEGNIKAVLSPVLSKDISCRYFKTHAIPDLVDTLSLAAKIYAGNVNTPINTFDDDRVKKFFDYKAYEIFNIEYVNSNPVIKGYKEIAQVVLESRLPNTLINFGNTQNIEIATIGTFIPNNDKVNPPFTYKVEGIKIELGLIPSSPQDAIKLIEIIKAAIKEAYPFGLNKLFISDVIIEKQAFSKGKFGY